MMTRGKRRVAPAQPAKKRSAPKSSAAAKTKRRKTASPATQVAVQSTPQSIQPSHLESLPAVSSSPAPVSQTSQSLQDVAATISNAVPRLQAYAISLRENREL